MRGTNTIYLIRHGKIQTVDEKRRYIGQMDVPLNDEGIKEAQLLQHKLVEFPMEAVYCSDLSRSRQTAEIIVGNRSIPIIENINLREIDVGDWEGCTFEDIKQRFPLEFKARGEDIEHYPIPGGESFADLNKRVIPVFHEMLNRGIENILLVGHAGVNRLLLCYALGLPLNNLFRLAQDYGCLNLIQYSHKGYLIKLMNDTSAVKEEKIG
ncbi:MAG: alpha-ribazole phosphatase [Pelosinus sp.]|nr:alpha-ribazole phosphatase [Pelosinus sp.]